MQILRGAVGTFDRCARARGCPRTGAAAQLGPTMRAAIAPDVSVYGPGGAPIPSCGSITARPIPFSGRSSTSSSKRSCVSVSEAKLALDDMLHELPGPRAALRALSRLPAAHRIRAHRRQPLTQKHLDFYYRTILGLKEKPAQPGHVHLLAQLAKQADSLRLRSPGALFKAGKDVDGQGRLLRQRRRFRGEQGVHRREEDRLPARDARRSAWRSQPDGRRAASSLRRSATPATAKARR